MEESNKDAKPSVNPEYRGKTPDQLMEVVRGKVKNLLTLAGGGAKGSDTKEYSMTEEAAKKAIEGAMSGGPDAILSALKKGGCKFEACPPGSPEDMAEDKKEVGMDKGPMPPMSFEDKRASIAKEIMGK